MFFKLLMTFFVASMVVESIDTNKIIPTYQNWSNSIYEQLESDDVLTLYLQNWKPLGSLQIKYPEDRLVELGNYLSPLKTSSIPVEFTFKSFTPITKQFKKEYYSITLTDLDSNPGDGGSYSYEKCHSIWQNLKFNEDDFTIIDNPDDKKSFITTFDITSFQKSQLMEYIGPEPKPNTDVHRYVFILFRQPFGKLPNHKLRFRERWGSEYEGHGVEDWANYYGLKPIAINYFKSSNED